MMPLIMMYIRCRLRTIVGYRLPISVSRNSVGDAVQPSSSSWSPIGVGVEVTTGTEDDRLADVVVE